MGAAALFTPAFQRANTWNSAGTGVFVLSTSVTLLMFVRPRLRGRGTPERTTSLLRATPAVSRTARVRSTGVAGGQAASGRLGFEAGSPAKTVVSGRLKANQPVKMKEIKLPMNLQYFLFILDASFLLTYERSEEHT